MPSAATRVSMWSCYSEACEELVPHEWLLGNRQLDGCFCSLVGVLELPIPLPTTPTIHLYPPFLLRTLCCPGLNIGIR